MGKSLINDASYYQVSGWMVNDLGLKGVDLKLYAIIYGFSQDGKSYFEGSIAYLQDFTNAGRNTVIRALKRLLDGGLVLKKERLENGVKYVSYKVDLQEAERIRGGSAKMAPPVPKRDGGSAKMAPGGSAKMAPNNIDIDNIADKYRYIVEYLNKKAGTKYKPTREKTREHINARLAEGHTVEDFYKVIDNKCLEWIGTEFEKYLRPDTLFGTKFEGYLNSKPTPPKQGNQGGGKPAPTDYGSPEDFYN
jgi:uncharacterized phage protein (TIGR02220 family)